jgi:fatty acid desaturase
VQGSDGNVVQNAETELLHPAPGPTVPTPGAAVRGAAAAAVVTGRADEAKRVGRRRNLLLLLLLLLMLLLMLLLLLLLLLLLPLLPLLPLLSLLPLAAFCFPVNATAIDVSETAVTFQPAAAAAPTIAAAVVAAAVDAT